MLLVLKLCFWSSFGFGFEVLTYLIFDSDIRYVSTLKLKPKPKLDQNQNQNFKTKTQISKPKLKNQFWF
jgi:hypothetical protein